MIHDNATINPDIGAYGTVWTYDTFLNRRCSAMRLSNFSGVRLGWRLRMSGGDLGKTNLGRRANEGLLIRILLVRLLRGRRNFLREC